MGRVREKQWKIRSKVHTSILKHAEYKSKASPQKLQQNYIAPKIGRQFELKFDPQIASETAQDITLYVIRKLNHLTSNNL